MDDTIEVRIRCDHEKCNWFHSFHEGHKFSYWEDGELILGKG
jgi:hypothetical protein